MPIQSAILSAEDFVKTPVDNYRVRARDEQIRREGQEAIDKLHHDLKQIRIALGCDGSELNQLLDKIESIRRETWEKAIEILLSKRVGHLDGLGCRSFMVELLQQARDAKE